MEIRNDKNYLYVKLLADSPFAARARTEREYRRSLKEKNLLQNHYAEAGMIGEEFVDIPFMYGLWNDTDYHRGWEDPTCQVRGQFLGHWISASCYMYHLTDDERLKGKVNYIISELARCQERNGRGWAAPIPEKYFEWVEQGKSVWAPHYNVHKLFMGLNDAYGILGNKQALEIACRFADWFYDWSKEFSEEKMQRILDTESGGMMEALADLYSYTQNPKHLELMQRYEHKKLFNRLLAGEDILTNQHANTTIPEVHGICRAWELTGEQRYLDIMTAYWNCAVEERGTFVTGGQNLGEIWSPKKKMRSRTGHKSQEHCTVYNMIRLADYLYRASGDVKYQDYIEENLYNGTLAQCFWSGYGDDYGHHSSHSIGLKSTTVSYFLPSNPGAVKQWSSETNSFFCCHGSAVQACAAFHKYIFYKTEPGLIMNQYIPSVYNDGRKRVELEKDPLTEYECRPDFWRFHIRPSGGQFELKLRIPRWAVKTRLSIDHTAVDLSDIKDGYIILNKHWDVQDICVDFYLRIEAVKLPGSNLYGFREGPVALAGLTGRQMALSGSLENAADIFVPYSERQWAQWNNMFITQNQEENIIFKYLYEIYDETYTTYFQLKE